MSYSQEIYVGVMSGTSLDGVDVLIADFSNDTIKILTSKFYPYSPELTLKVKNLNNIPELNVELGILYADCINDTLKTANLEPEAIRAIGLHGQTIDHQPHGEFPFSLQIGDANIVSYKTRITTVADFRNKDICAGGEGAPLTPILHARAFAEDDKNIAVLNIGGIANITIVPKDKSSEIMGFDTGPGNCLLDDWIYKKSGTYFDKDGKWAQSGKVDEALLSLMLNDVYFQQEPPKSTGREYFNLTWLETFDIQNHEPQDIQATITELSAESITNAIKPYAIDKVLVCGGGLKNKYLISRVEDLLEGVLLHSTLDKSIDPDMVEALAFALLAKLTIDAEPGNIPSVTGARQKVILGAVYKSG